MTTLARYASLGSQKIHKINVKHDRNLIYDVNIKIYHIINYKFMSTFYIISIPQTLTYTYISLMAKR
jgi:hypothetical protein